MEMDFTITFALAVASILVLTAVFSIAATLLILHHCFHLQRPNSIGIIESSPPPQQQPQQKQEDAAYQPVPTTQRAIQETLFLKKGTNKEAWRCTWEEIMSLTDNFTAKVIGQGGFSTVYLGSLPGGCMAAVKVHRCGGGERLLRAFRLELDLLQRLRHPNVVRLLAFSDDHEEGALVLEYLPNGTLADHLHGSSSVHAPLSWASRMRILYEIAGALEHLHDDSGTQIVHGDVTAANVLLDASFGTRLCDFGSARAGFQAAVARGSGHGLAYGSPGYTDPYFLRTGLVSKKSDVYSFGVLLLEVITGMPAVGLDCGRNLTVVVAPRIKLEGVAGLVDPTLQGIYDVAEAAAMAVIALECVGPQPGLRPSVAWVRTQMREKVQKSIFAVDRKLNVKENS